MGICGKSFGYNHVLKLHQVAHFGEKVYKCTLCKTTFNNKKQLETHIKSHDDNMADMLSSPPRPSSVGSSHSETSTSSDKENSNLFRPNLFYPLSRSPISLVPPPAHLSTHQTSDPMDAHIILVTASLVKSLMKADLEEYGPPNPLATPPLRQETFSKFQTPIPAPAASPSPLSPTMSMMRESSLPLRKRRLALSECSESSTDSSVKDEREAPSPTNRGSVIMFAARS